MWRQSRIRVSHFDLEGPGSDPYTLTAYTVMLMTLGQTHILPTLPGKVAVREKMGEKENNIADCFESPLGRKAAYNIILLTYNL